MDRRPLSNFIQAGGGVEPLMEQLRVSRRTLFNWKAASIPADRVPEVERITGIPRHELRPDLWEPPARAAQPEAAA